jgi:uncharacterized damage-inducible protein DinB
MTREEWYELFDYDLWAHMEWVAIIDTLPFAERAKEILAHNLNAQKNWLAKCLSEEDAGELTGDLTADFADMNAKWKDLIRTCDPTAYISYNRQGEEQMYFHMVEEVARHVINHGTYHRGHLRGLCDAHSITDFPDTDYVKYLRNQA